MAVVILLLHFLACDEEIVAAGRDNVVSAVGRGIIGRFVLAHEDNGNARGKAAQGRSCGGGEGDMVPGAGIGEAGLSGRVSCEGMREWVGRSTLPMV